MTDEHQHSRLNELVPHAIRGYRGIHLTVAYFAIFAIASLVLGFLEEGFFARILIYSVAGVYAWTAFALFTVRKSGWHLASFLAFLTIILNAVALSCAPGKIADGEMNLLQVAFDMLTLVLSVLILGYLRRSDIREMYGVPLSYRLDDDGPG